MDGMGRLAVDVRDTNADADADADQSPPFSEPLLSTTFPFTSQRVYVSIAGLIGAGKTTLAKSIAEHMDLPVHYEPVADNAYLEDFYKDMSAHGFRLQVYLLTRRFQQQQEIVWSGKGGVQDRTIYEDAIFAKMLHDDGLMNERDYHTYHRLFETMHNLMPRPNVIVYLDVSPEESLRRIRARSRKCEAGITIEYLTKLHAGYTSFIKDIGRHTPVIRLDWNSFAKTSDVVAQLTGALKG